MIRHPRAARSGDPRTQQLHPFRCSSLDRTVVSSFLRLMTFAIDPAFETVSAFLADLPLCQARLMDDARFPWLVLLPRVTGAVELTDLSPDRRAALMDEIVLACAAVRAMGEAAGRPVEKLNVAAIGNVTPQLHVHVVGRRRDDGVWPDPVWGRGAPLAYAERDRVRASAAALSSLNGS